MFFATDLAKHTGKGGAVPLPHEQVHAHSVYCLIMNTEDRVEKMVKIWNAPWTMQELGWA